MTNPFNWNLRLNINVQRFSLDTSEDQSFNENAKTVLVCSSESPDEKDRACEHETYTVMISSSVHNYKDQLLTIRDYFLQKGFNVIMSMDGTIFADPRLGNFDNCLEAVKACDIFFGVIRPYCGSGRDGGESITFKEFKQARESHKPCWYVIDNRISHFHDLFHALQLKKDIGNEEANRVISVWLETLRKNEKKVPEVLDLFEPDRSRRFFDPECFAMEAFVNQLDIPRSEVVNNWMHYFDDIKDIKSFIDTNFSKMERIDEIVREA